MTPKIVVIHVQEIRFYFSAPYIIQMEVAAEVPAKLNCKFAARLTIKTFYIFLMKRHVPPGKAAFAPFSIKYRKSQLRNTDLPPSGYGYTKSPFLMNPQLLLAVSIDLLVVF